MRTDWWVYKFHGWGFYTGVRVGHLLLGVGSDGVRDFDLGIEFKVRHCDAEVYLKLGLIYLMISVDYTYGRDNNTDGEGATPVAVDTGPDSGGTGY